MEEKKASKMDNSLSTTSSTEVYIPSSTEKKRAVMMYLLVGIIIGILNNDKKNVFESFHLKQALGRRAVFILLMIITSLLIFLPFVKYIPLLVIIGMLVGVAIFVKQARDGTYIISEDKNNNKLAIFHALGHWILMIFEIQEDASKKQDHQEIPSKK